VVGFRGADGSVVVQRDAAGPIRLAPLDRPDVTQVAQSAPSSGGQSIAMLSGAIPATSLQALQMALERTAAAGGYKLPLASLVSAPNALDVGSTMMLDPADPRRFEARLAGTP